MKETTVILAAGDFPRKGGATWKLLNRASATTVTLTADRPVAVYLAE